ncbi:tripartite motif-containing protein 16-like [Etheostoma cragini]|uniref:tripartite motif-containing protein 16-like n=1 Tax=Etheostoma cragini TaxID=417921 RepID=UPI00155E9FF1|nr:tripartite motif-containing protein 16-like [Etheostoma cragini]
MAQKGVQLDRETFSCSFCLDLLKLPVTIPCGHSYCMNCIKGFWDQEDEKKIYSCPQCKQTFTPRPVLLRNTMLAVVVEELKKTCLPDEDCFAGPEDVACDFCRGRKLKALKSCKECLVSYCEKHLQPHLDAAQLKKHKLVDPAKKIQEGTNVCPRHNEGMQMFCRTDQKFICYLCPLDEHKGHDTVSVAAERAKKQGELDGRRQNIQQRLQDREKEVKLLPQEAEAIDRSADEAVEDSGKIFKELIGLLEKKSSDVEQTIRSQQKTEASRVRELREKLEQEIAELKRNDGELMKLSHTEDHNQFLQEFPTLSPISAPTNTTSTKMHALWFFKDVTAAVSEVGAKLQKVLAETWTNVNTRAVFLKFSSAITLDPETVNSKLLISEGNRKVRFTTGQLYVGRSARFATPQVLSKESLTGRCYWEVELRGEEVCVAVAYSSISRKGSSTECTFGAENDSWALSLYGGYSDDWAYFRYNNVQTPVSGPRSSRIGVYLDHSAGTLLFYSVSETMTLLHRVQTTFTQPLHAGFGLSHYEDTAEFIELK